MLFLLSPETLVTSFQFFSIILYPIKEETVVKENSQRNKRRFKWTDATIVESHRENTL